MKSGTKATLLVLEDEPLVAEQICDELRSQLEPQGVQVVHADNLETAAEFAQSEDMRYLIADAVVKDTPASTRSTADAQSLLRSLRGQRFITTIAHTAYREKSATIAKGNLADIIVDKHSRDSTEEVIKQGVRVATQRELFCRTLWHAFNSLRDAVECNDPIDKQAHIRQSRSQFGMLTTPEFAPDNYRQATIWLSTFGMRLSSVPSERFGLFTLDEKLFAILQPVIHKLIGTRFSFEVDAVPAMMRLEALGYPVLMRIDV